MSERGKKSRGFTIVELLVVVAILSVLVGLVTAAVGGSLRNGRAKRSEAMCRVLQQAIAMYYTKVGEWPPAIEAKANNMTGDSDSYTFSAEETDQIIREIVKKSTGSGATMALLDASALYVANAGSLRNNGEGCYDNHGDKSRTSYCGNQGCVSGMDFTQAVKTGAKGKQGGGGGISINNMAFGYQATRSGKFSRYWVTYNSKTDSVTVSRQNPKKSYPDDWN